MDESLYTILYRRCTPDSLPERGCLFPSEAPLGSVPAVTRPSPTWFLFKGFVHLIDSPAEVPDV
jgi:hypothetical protein